MGGLACALTLILGSIMIPLPTGCIHHLRLMDPPDAAGSWCDD